ncbi:hypothetical protein Q0Z83_039960 [Actinoplanes sichuanensis]|uniref:hypothetical protein n=1 Tax=Actinoplanes sichuanensis TaxID=512349 RepID=UPI00367143F3|nr:hypothetical protein Q0Z83_039960 [Actinoplanes sichuanensis]
MPATVRKGHDSTIRDWPADVGADGDPDDDGRHSLLIRSNRTIGELRTAVVDFVRGLDLHEVTPSGESLGGALSLTASIDLKDRVTRVVAFNSYDYPRGGALGNLIARLIINSILVPMLGRPVFALERPRHHGPDPARRSRTLTTTIAGRWRPSCRARCSWR